MDPLGDHPDEMWDEEDGFFYDVLRMPDGTGRRIKVRSLVGLLPLCATAVVPPEHLLDAVPARRPSSCATTSPATPTCSAATSDPRAPGVDGRRLLALVDERKLRRILERMLDEDRFLGPHGIRSVSKWHEEHPYTIDVDGQPYTVDYEPAESRSGMFGGNSNWRGPVWFPINLLLIRALLQFYLYYGDDFRIECPTGSGHEMNLYEVAEELSRRLATTFTRDADGRRPVFGGDRALPGRPDLGRQHPVLRVLPRRQRRRDRRLAPDRLDRRGRPAHPAVREHRRGDLPARGHSAVGLALGGRASGLPRVLAPG